jgi:ribosome recycling factor
MGKPESSNITRILPSGVTSTGEETHADKAIFSLRQESLRHGRSNYQHLDNLATDSVWIETDLVEPATIGAADTRRLSTRFVEN